jgi:hypothetical protein
MCDALQLNNYLRRLRRWVAGEMWTGTAAGMSTLWPDLDKKGFALALALLAGL